MFIFCKLFMKFLMKFLVTKRDMFTKSKDTALQDNFHSVLCLFFIFSCIKLLPNRSDFTLNVSAGAWPRFEGKVKFTRKAIIPLPLASGSLFG